MSGIGPRIGRTPAAASVVTLAFGATVSMWALGYLARLPAVALPSPLLVAVFVICLLAAGVATRRLAGLGALHAGAIGFAAGVLNLLVLGSFLSTETPNVLHPAAGLWAPGFVLFAAAICGLGALATPSPATAPAWSPDAALVRIAAGAALFLLLVGGVVTSADAGLAVVDWPNSYGYNMFLYPFSKMTGGIYYEHAHRLFAFLVGLTTLAMATILQVREPRRWVRGLAWGAVVLVALQAVLGGLRVTGRFTLSDSPEFMRPSVVLGMIHGVVAQVFLALLVALSVFTSPGWVGSGLPLRRRSVTGDRRLGALLVGGLLAQTALGAAQRHLDVMLMVHMAVGIAVVAPLALHVGLRAWGVHEDVATLRRLGLALMGAVATQIVLGLAAYAVTASSPDGAVPPGWEILLATAHQWFGAVLLGLAVALRCWQSRLVEPDSSRPDGARGVPAEAR